jgi:hypothetical protein
MANVDISWIAPAIGTLGNITSFTHPASPKSPQVAPTLLYKDKLLLR